MDARRRILSIILALTVIVSPFLPWMQETVLAAEETFTFDSDDVSYEALKKALGYKSNQDAGAISSDSFNDAAKTITIDLEKVRYFELNFSMGRKELSVEALDFINSLFSDSVSLRTVVLNNVDLSNIDLLKLNGKNSLEGLTVVKCDLQSIPDISLPGLITLNMSENNFSGSDACAGLTDANFQALKNLNLYNCGLTGIPDVTLSNLEELVLSGNAFSAAGACDNLKSTNFPKLKSLYLDWCGISDIDFLQKMDNSTLTVLSLGRNKLTDASLDSLISMKDSALQNLAALRIGSRVYKDGGQSEQSSLGNSNIITDTAKMASLPNAFPKLKTLDLSNLEITSLEDFKNVSSDINIYFDSNKIVDFAGLENNNNIYLSTQSITLTDKLNPGEENELPELLQRILDPDDALKGTLSYQNCSLSDDGTKLVIKPNVSWAQVKVDSGKLNGSTIEFSLRKIPSYTIPQNLTATVGDTLAKVVLPAGFAWKDSTLDVGAEGVNTFKAVYTPQDTDQYAVVTVDVPVTVKASTVTEPTEPSEPTTEPTEPSEPTTEPTEPVTPTNPVDPTEPVNPTEPAKPSEPATEPTEPVTPTSPINPTEPTKPSEPVTEPTEPTAATLDEYEEDNEDETEEAQVVATVKTSDTSPVIPVTVVMFVSGVILCFMISDKKNQFNLKK